MHRFCIFSTFFILFRDFLCCSYRFQDFRKMYNILLSKNTGVFYNKLLCKSYTYFVNKSIQNWVFKPSVVKIILCVIFAYLFNLANMLELMTERWQSGRMHRSWKPAWVYSPSRVQIPISPPPHSLKPPWVAFFLFITKNSLTHTFIFYIKT